MLVTVEEGGGTNEEDLLEERVLGSILVMVRGDVQVVSGRRTGR
jgi:hypothetical protein